MKYNNSNSLITPAPFQQPISSELRNYLLIITRLALKPYNLETIADQIIKCLVDDIYPINTNSPIFTKLFGDDSCEIKKSYNFYKTHKKHQGVLMLIEDYLNGNNLLDVGCGNNTVANAINQQYKIKTCGTDIHKTNNVSFNDNVDYSGQSRPLIPE